MDRLDYLRKEYHVAYQEIEQDSLMLLKHYIKVENMSRKLDDRYRSALIENLIDWGFLERPDPLSQAMITNKGMNAVQRGWVYDSQWINK